MQAALESGASPGCTAAEVEALGKLPELAAAPGHLTWVLSGPFLSFLGVML